MIFIVNTYKIIFFEIKRKKVYLAGFDEDYIVFLFINDHKTLKKFKFCFQDNIKLFSKEKNRIIKIYIIFIINYFFLIKPSFSTK